MWIDPFRGKPEAVTFFEGLRTAPALSPLVVAKLFAGATGAGEIGQISLLERQCLLLPLNSGIARKGGKLSQQYRPSHGTGHRRTAGGYGPENGHGLATLNRKQFPMLDGHELHQPY